MNSQSEIPVLDVSAIVRGDSPGIDDMAREMGEACRGIGFFCVTGHGIDLPVLREAFEMSRAFFALPLEQKMAVTMTRSPNNLGYMPFEGEIDALLREKFATVKKRPYGALSDRETYLSPLLAGLMFLLPPLRLLGGARKIFYVCHDAR